MPVHGVTGAEHAPPRVFGGIAVVHRPQRRRGDPHRDVGHAEQVADDLGRGRVVDLRRRLVDVVTPGQQPLVPRAHHPHQAHADAADIRTGPHHPVQDARPVRDVAGQIGLEHDVHRARLAAAPADRQPDLLGDHAAATVRADQVAGADRVLLAAHPVQHARGHPVGILFQRQELGVQPDLRPALGRVGQQDRLQVGLWQVDHAARAGHRILRQRRRSGPPRPDPADLLTDQPGAQHGVAHQVLRRADRQRLLLDAKVAQDFQGALVGDVRAGRVRDPAVLGHHRGGHTVGRQDQRGGATGRPAANHEDIGIEAHDNSGFTGAMWNVNSSDRHSPSTARPSGAGPVRGTKSTISPDFTPNTVSESR